MKDKKHRDNNNSIENVGNDGLKVQSAIYQAN